MPEVLHGGCKCERIRYTITGPFNFVCQCCCIDCQKCTGTGHTTIVGMDRDQLNVHKGKPKQYETFGDTGGSVVRHFCENCGGRLYTSGDAPGRVIMIQSGSLDNPSAVEPTSVIYLKDATKWDRFDDKLDKFQGMPDASYFLPKQQREV